MTLIIQQQLFKWKHVSSELPGYSGQMLTQSSEKYEIGVV